MQLTHGSLFTGFGGFDLGFERAGMITKWQVEIGDYPSRVLAKHWPDVARFRDVHDCGAHNLSPVDVISGGFPCQPFSVAGLRRGAADDRFLWPEMLRIVTELRPTWVVAENVPGIVNMVLDDICAALEALQYETGTIEIPAGGVGAWHKRLRTFVIAHVDRAWQQQSAGMFTEERRRFGDNAPTIVADVDDEGPGTRRESSTTHREDDADWPSPTIYEFVRCRRTEWPAEPDVARVVHGLPTRLERSVIRERIAGLGNAVVPRVAEVIGRFIVAAEEMHSVS